MYLEIGRYYCKICELHENIFMYHEIKIENFLYKENIFVGDENNFRALNFFIGEK